LPPIDPRARAAVVAELALLDEPAVFAFRVLLAAERNRAVYEGVKSLSRSSRGAGVGIDALVALGEAMGVGEATMLAALSPSAPLLCKGLAEASGDDGTTLARRLSLPDRVARVLVDGDDGLPTDLPLVLEPVRPLAELCLADHQPDELTTVDTLRHL